MTDFCARHATLLKKADCDAPFEALIRSASRRSGA